MNEQTDFIAEVKTLASALVVAYSALRASVCAMQVTEAGVAEARSTLATARADVLISHSEDINALGTNEAVREANIGKMVEKERAALSDAESTYTSCRNAHQLTTLEVEALRAQLRCLEAIAAVMGGKDA